MGIVQNHRPSGPALVGNLPLPSLTKRSELPWSGPGRSLCDDDEACPLPVVDTP